MAFVARGGENAGATRLHVKLIDDFTRETPTRGSERTDRGALAPPPAPNA